MKVMTIIISRHFKVKRNNQSDYMIVPMADMFNY